MTGLIALGAALSKVETLEKQQTENTTTIVTLKKDSTETIEKLKNENTSKFEDLKKENQAEVQKVLGAEKLLLDAKKELVTKTLELEQAKVKAEVWASRSVLTICGL